MPGEPDADIDVFEAWEQQHRRRPDRRRRGLRRRRRSIRTSRARSSAAMTSSTTMTIPAMWTATARTSPARSPPPRDNGVGIAGVAPDAMLVPLRVLSDGEGTDIETARGVRLGRRSRHPRRQRESRRSGILPSGVRRDRPTPRDPVRRRGRQRRPGRRRRLPPYPCAYDAGQRPLCRRHRPDDDRAADFSNYGAESVDVFAPGVVIVSTSGTVGYCSSRRHVDGNAARRRCRRAARGAQSRADAGDDQVGAAGQRRSEELARPVCQSAAHAPMRTRRCWPFRKIRTRRPCSSATSTATALRMRLTTAPARPTPTKATLTATASATCATRTETETGGPTALTTAPRSRTGAGRCGRDGLGDVCDPSPRGHDNDGDGKLALDDACPDVYGTLANGCPAPAPPPPPNVDGDNRIDSLDACPTEYAISNDGCPIAQIAAVSPRVKKRSATVTVSTSRAATVQDHGRSGRRAAGGFG